MTRRGRREIPSSAEQKRVKKSEISSQKDDSNYIKSKQNNIFAPVNFGAKLFSGIGGDSKNSIHRRRALTDVEDLIEKDIVNNQGRPLIEKPLFDSKFLVDNHSDLSSGKKKKREEK